MFDGEQFIAWLGDGWDHYWIRTLMLVAIAGILTLTAGLIAWLSGAFKLDRDDIRNVGKHNGVLPLKVTSQKFSALPSEEPEDASAN
jgi:hypothetical protein